MLYGLKFGQVKKIASASRKLQLNKDVLDKLIEARKNGDDDNTVISKLLNVPEGVEPKEYIQQKVTPQEYEALRELIHAYTKGAGTNPLD